MTMGRPPVLIDWEEVGNLYMAGTSTESIARQLGITARTLYDRCEQDLKMKLSHFSQKKREKGDNLLRAAQFKNAMSGNTSMQIWLGKQRLGQREPKSEDTEKTQNNTYYVNYDPKNPLPVLSKAVPDTDPESPPSGDKESDMGLSS